MQRILELQADLLADDLPVGEHMCAWAEDQVTAYFESGGTEVPDSAAGADAASVAPTWSEAQSSADARTVRSLEDAQEQNIADDAVADEIGDEFGSLGVGRIDGDGDDQFEDAMLDDPMASVRVTGRTPPSAAPAAADPPRSECEGWSIKQLKAALQVGGIDPSGFSEKRELVAAVASLAAAGSGSGGGSAGASAGTGGGTAAAAGPAAAPPSERGRRLVVKVEDIKKSADRCFGDHDFRKAEEKYSKCLGLLAEPAISDETGVRTLCGALLSNRSACRAHLNRHAEALQVRTPQMLESFFFFLMSYNAHHTS